MKHIYRFVYALVAGILSLTGCQEMYLDEYDALELDYSTFSVKAEGGRHTLMVYFSGEWTISLKKDVEWAKFETLSGNGVTPVHIDFNENFALKRSFDIVITGGGESKGVTVTQAASVDKVILEFNSTEPMKLANRSGLVSARLNSNLPADFIESCTPVVEFNQGKDWLSKCEIRKSEFDSDFDVVFEVSANETGAARSANVSLTLTDEDGVSYTAAVEVNQGIEAGDVFVAENLICASRTGWYSIRIEGGYEYFTSLWKIEGEPDFIDNIVVRGGMLTCYVKENTEDVKREAKVNLVYDGKISKTVNIVQREAGLTSIIEISNADELLAWNKNIAQWKPNDIVLLTDDIDCSSIKSEDWIPNIFYGFFDGNGKTIDNLVIQKDGPAAFFFRVHNGVVENLTFGEGCSFITNGPTTSSPVRVYAASLAAEATGTTSFANIVNKGTVGTTKEAKGGVAGNYVAGICSSYGSTGDLTGCQNYGSVTFSALPEAWMNCAGLFGQVAFDVTLTDCVNYGHVMFNGKNNESDSKKTKTLNIAGITATANGVNFDSCVNFGKIQADVDEVNTGVINLGGIVAVLDKAVGTITNCLNGAPGDENKGTLLNTSNSSGVVRMGGFVGSILLNEINISGFKNYGTVRNDGEVSNWPALGGVVGYVGALKTNVNTISSCENHGLIENTAVKGRTTLGGVVGFIQNAGTTVTLNRNYGEIRNTGDASANCGVTLGGIVGRIEAADGGENFISDCENFGKVHFDAASAYDSALSGGIGGILGVHAGEAYKVEEDGNTKYYHKNAKLTISGCSNSGNVRKTKKGSNYMNLGGIVAFLNGDQEPDNEYINTSHVINCTNNADVINESTGSEDWNAYIGGIIGNFHVKGELKGCRNNGSVINRTDIASTTFVRVRIGGVVGSAENGKVSDSFNSGVVMDDSESNAGCVGGVVGCIATRDMKMTGCTNTGKISGKFNDTDKPSTVCLGGLLGYSAASVSMSDCSNSAKISKDNAKASDVYIAGIAAYLNGISNTVSNVVNCTNSAEATILNGASEVSGKVYAGGIIGFHNVGGTVTNCKNYASVLNTSKTYGNVAIGGITGGANNGTMNNCVNSGAVKDDSESDTGTLAGIAGCVDSRAMTMTNCDNTGEISGKFESSESTAMYIAGAIANTKKTVTLDGCDMTGNLYCNRTTKASHLYMGGLVAYASKVNANIDPKVVLKNCNISGTIENKTVSVATKTGMGGFIGFCCSNEIENCHTTASIINASTANVYVGGFVGQIEGNDPISTDIRNCSVNSVVTPNVIDYAGMLVGRLTYSTTTTTTTKIVNMKNIAVVGGTYDGTPLSEENYDICCYGMKAAENSHYKPLEGVYFGKFKND